MSRADLKSLAASHGYILLAGNYMGDTAAQIKELEAEYIEESFRDFDFAQYYADDMSTEDFAGKIMSPPMLSKKKIIVVHGGHELDRDRAAFVDESASGAAPDILVIILCINEAAPFFETLKKAGDRFKGAYLVRMEMPKRMSKDGVMKMSAEMGLKLPVKIADTIYEKSDGEYSSVKNILQMGYMINDTEVFSQIFESGIYFDNYAFVTFDFIKAFFDRDVELATDLYERMTKWKLMNTDGVAVMMLKQISKKLASGAAYGGWSAAEMKSAYEEFYELLRSLRKYRAEFAPLLMEETLMKTLMKGDKWI